MASIHTTVSQNVATLNQDCNIVNTLWITFSFKIYVFQRHTYWQINESSFEDYVQKYNDCSLWEVNLLSWHSRWKICFNIYNFAKHELCCSYSVWKIRFLRSLTFREIGKWQRCRSFCHKTLWTRVWITKKSLLIEEHRGERALRTTKEGQDSWIMMQKWE